MGQHVCILMRIFSKKTVRAFWQTHPETESYLTTWYRVTSKREWSTPADVKADYGNASILPDNRVVFNVKGNDYRLVVKINYEKRWLFIRFIGTHAAYDRIDATTI